MDLTLNNAPTTWNGTSVVAGIEMPEGDADSTMLIITRQNPDEGEREGTYGLLHIGHNGGFYALREWFAIGTLADTLEFAAGIAENRYERLDAGTDHS